jgi:hypothetical protein
VSTQVPNTDHPNVTLRDLLEQRFDDMEKSIDRRFEHMEEATRTAYSSMESRLAVMNEIRGQLNDQASTFLTREASDLQHTRIEEDIRSLRESRSLLEGKASQTSVMITIVIAVLGLLVGIVGLTRTMDKPVGGLTQSPVTVQTGTDRK